MHPPQGASTSSSPSLQVRGGGPTLPTVVTWWGWSLLQRPSDFQMSHSPPPAPTPHALRVAWGLEASLRVTGALCCGQQRLPFVSPDFGPCRPGVRSPALAACCVCRNCLGHLLRMQIPGIHLQRPGFSRCGMVPGALHIQLSPQVMLIQDP